MNLRVWAAVALVSLAVTACGGQGGTDSTATEDAPSTEPTEAAKAPSTDEWVDLALAECEKVNEAADAAEPEGDPFSPQATDADREQGVAYLNAFGDSLDSFATNLREAGLPEGDQESAEALVTAAEDSAAAFDDAAAAAEEDFSAAQESVGAAFGSFGQLEAAANAVGIGDLENCSREGAPAEEVAEGANEVPVVATKDGDQYTFEFDQQVPAGQTAFVMANEDDEAHFMAIVEVTEPGALAKAINAEKQGNSERANRFLANEDVGGSQDAGPGEEAVANVELTPGTYGMLCFIPGPDGQPHAFSGMAVEFQVQ